MVIPNPVVIDTLSFEDVNLIFKNSGCIACHSGGGTLPTLDKYSSKLFKAIKHEAGDGKNMPPSGKISETDIDKIVTWVRQGIKQ